MKTWPHRLLTNYNEPHTILQSLRHVCVRTTDGRALSGTTKDKLAPAGGPRVYRRLWCSSWCTKRRRVVARRGKQDGYTTPLRGGKEESTRRFRLAADGVKEDYDGSVFGLEGYPRVVGYGSNRGDGSTTARVDGDGDNNDKGVEEQRDANNAALILD
ncbi:hypothetical protein BHE74_00046014 [Ensete ventricosum]|nr:hypothetical protein BHE74_00046014 [Ensete ventricosum]